MLEPVWLCKVKSEINGNRQVRYGMCGVDGGRTEKKKREMFQDTLDAKSYFRELALLEFVFLTELLW